VIRQTLTPLIPGAARRCMLATTRCTFEGQPGKQPAHSLMHQYAFEYDAGTLERAAISASGGDGIVMSQPGRAVTE